MTVFVAGSLNMDLVVTAKRLPLTGETLLGESFNQYPGGKGLNQAVAASRAGAETKMIGALGSDDHGKLLEETLIDANIDIQGIQHYSGSSGVALIEVDSDARNRILVVPEANAKISADSLNRDFFKNSHTGSILLGPLENPIDELEKIFIKAKEAGLRTILNPAPANNLSDAFMKSIDILIPNQYEAELLTGVKVKDVDTAIEAAKILLKMGPKSVIVTLGELGSLYRDKDKSLFQPPFKVESIDTTAAGDTFCGAFAAAISNNSNIEEAMKFAACAAALSTMKVGAVPSIPTSGEIFDYL